MLSVVTIECGEAGLAEKTAASLAAQASVQIEHLIVDVADSRWRGRAAARNEGMRRASGDIIAFLDAGDQLEAGAAGKALGFFAASPGARVLYGRARLGGDQRSAFPECPTRPWSYHALQCEPICCRPAMFWRRDVAARFGVFDERLRYAYDFEYWLRVGAHTAFEYYPDEILASCHRWELAIPVAERLRAAEEMLDVISRHATQVAPLHHRLRKLARQAARLAVQGHGPDREECFRRNYASAILAYADRFQIPLTGLELAAIPAADIQP